jgi:hypothetical protein
MKPILATISLAVLLSVVSAPVLAVDMSANIGYNSQYIYRGIPQKNSSAFGFLRRAGPTHRFL